MTLHFYLARNRATFEAHMIDRGTPGGPLERRVHRLIETPQDTGGLHPTNCQLHLLTGWEDNPVYQRDPSMIERLRSRFPHVFARPA